MHVISLNHESAAVQDEDGNLFNQSLHERLLRIDYASQVQQIKPISCSKLGACDTARQQAAYAEEPRAMLKRARSICLSR